MSSMVIDRRSILLGTVTAIASRRLMTSSAMAEPRDGTAFATAAQLPNGSFTVILLTSDGRVVRTLPLSDRGHDIAVHRPLGLAVAFARRPGTFAVAFSTSKLDVPQIFTTPTGRHFFGHGVFSADGRLLYTTENEIDTGDGVIGIYDVGRGFARIGEHRTFGVGPHEIILLRDGATLAIANGGLDTMPDAGRENLNVDTMQASLTFVDAASGELRAKHALESSMAQLSIRHLAADSQYGVWFGGQWQGDITEVPELVGSAHQDRPPVLISPRAPLGRELKGYIGSMAASADGSVIAASAPKAGRILYVDAVSAKVVGESRIKDGCGIAPTGAQSFAVTSGLGTFRTEDVSARLISEAELSGIAFDNHLRRLS